MIALPSDAALIEIFENEPTLADADAPWSYNTMTFVMQREDERIELVINPSEDAINIEWSRGGRVVFCASLTDVSSVQSTEENSVFKIHYKKQQLQLEVRPSFCVRMAAQ